ncbi:MAG: transporter [Rickettsiaceae bacterium]|jgi:outer membrane protein assembly factor BamD|nr:transporter [Rickettsiaceae bacterium]
MKIFKIIALLSILFIGSCASKKETPSAELSYTKAMKKLKDRDYLSAAEDFEKISDEYPLSKWGVKSQTMAAYSYYKEEKLEDVIRIADDFVKNNPSNSDVAYMQYLKSISYYDQLNNIERAQDNAKSASYAFRELIARFPNTDYADDAREKLTLVDEHIAGAKMSIGRYQLQNGNYIGAIKNFQDVVNNYSRTKQTPEAYFRLFEASKIIGLDDVAQDYFASFKSTKVARSKSKK